MDSSQVHRRKRADAPGNHAKDLESALRAPRNLWRGTANNQSSNNNINFKRGNSRYNRLRMRNNPTSCMSFSSILKGSALFGFILWLRKNGLPSLSSSPSNRVRATHPTQVDFTFPWHPKSISLVKELTADDHIQESSDYPHFHDVQYYPIHGKQANVRHIDSNDNDAYNDYRSRVLSHLDSKTMESRYEGDEDLESEYNECRRTASFSKRYYTCNTVHELTVGRAHQRENSDFETTYLGHGHFRDAWKLDGSDFSQDFVLKRLRLNDSRGGRNDVHLVGRDATVMERLTQSPHIVSIYGFCSTTILSETIHSEVWQDIIPDDGRAEQKKLDKEPELTPRNNFTPEEKLQMALDMAYALADLHGFKEGVIYHGDTHPEQWLRAKDGSLKLNDFNNAVVMDYNVEHGTYCKEARHFGGAYRSPEEFERVTVGEQCDTFSMGNNIYTLLTGLWPFYNELKNGSKKIQEKLIKGERAFVDPRWKKRSYAERKLVEIMEASWHADPSKRISIFRMVELLREAIHKNNEKK